LQEALMQRFDEPAEPIQVAPKERFAIALPANPTTGYSWQATVDPTYVELCDQAFEPGGEAVGAAGREVFRFEARRAGKTEIAFEYRRPWGSSPRETRHCPLLIAE
jgi:inhibitor of cysteine peptidase